MSFVDESDYVGKATQFERIAISHGLTRLYLLLDCLMSYLQQLPLPRQWETKCLHQDRNRDLTLHRLKNV